MKKLINFILLKGAKRLSEQIFLGALKRLYYLLKVGIIQALKLSFIISTPIIRLIRSIHNKSDVVRDFALVKGKTRPYLAMKWLLQQNSNKGSSFFYKKLCKDVSLTIDSKILINVQTNSKLQNQLLLKKHIFFYFR